MTIDYEVIEVDYHRAEVAERIYVALLRPVIEVSMSGTPEEDTQDPPEISWGTAPGTGLTPDTSILLTLTGTDLVVIILSIKLDGVNTTETIFRAGEFTSTYSESVVTESGDNWNFEIKRNGGWIGSGIRLYIDVVDSSGQVPQ